MKSQPPIKKVCRVCGKEFFVYPYRKDTAKFCSHSCYATTVHLQPKTDNWRIAMKKKVSWNKGKELPVEMRAKLSLAQKRRFQNTTVWNKGLKGFLSGPKHYRWKNATTPNRLERLRFRNELQKKVFERDDYTCQLCGETGVALQVDHIQPWAEYVDGRFSLDNCRTLCMGCHYQITFGKPMPKSIKVWGHNLGRLST